MTNFNVENQNAAKDKGYEVGGQCAVVVLLLLMSLNCDVLTVN